ncbi:MAG: EpsG family protein [Lachnospiraceae bacterium]|nr:EpsG family protein [Lachnospiraceae bacterium]
MSFDTAMEMLRYALISTIICLLIALFYYYLCRKGNRIRPEDWLMMGLMVAVSSLRYGLGSDYIRYKNSAAYAVRTFQSLGSIFSAETLSKYDYEVGYVALSVLVGKITTNQYAIFWAVSLLLYVPLIIYCRKKTRDPGAAMAFFLLFGFWGMSLNVMKQAVAMMLVLFSYEMLKEKKYHWFLLLTAAAASFHITALVAAAVILVVHSGILKAILAPTKRNLLIMTGVGLLFRLWKGLIIKIVSLLGLYSKYMSFLNADTTSGIKRSFIMYGALIETVIVFALVYTAITRLDALKRQNPGIEKVISIIMVGIPFSIIGISQTLWLANRFAKFFFLFLIILVPELLERDRKPAPLPVQSRMILSRSQTLFWVGMVVWHAMYAVLMLDNNGFQIQSYLFLS